MGQATNPTATSIRLDGMIGKILRWLWIAFAIMSLSLLVISIKPVYEDSLTICDGDDCVFLNASSEQVAQYEATGFSFEAVATSSIITVTISAIIFTIVAAIIFFSHPDELIALMTAFMLVGVGITGPIDYLQPDNIFWEIGLRILQLVAVVGLVGFLFTFPNGRFVPGWTGWIFILILLATFVYVILVILDFVSPDFSGLAPLMVVGILSQFYRYWRVAKPEERQQAKWVIASLVVFLLPVIILSIFSSPIVEIILNAGLGIAMLTSLPIAILVSIHKYGLWNIDFYINRGIVYLTLTIVLIIVFAGIFFVLQSLFNTVLGSGQIGLELIVPTAIVVALFNPVRIRLRHLVDRHLYGIKMDYTRIIESRQRLLAKADVSTTIGQYRTSKVIGSGGMGEVYAGQDKEGQQVAIKVLHHKYEQEEELEKRFLREARATAQLEHSHIVKILDVGDDNGRLFIAMEYIKGQDWGAILKAEGTQSLEQILTHLQELASALDYVHQNGIIHRDIKPGNIMIEGETRRTVLMDFGIAKIVTEMTALTGTSQIVGSLDYISPEQIKGEENIDHRTDIYSFGVMTYQLLTGELPFHKNNAGALVMAHLLQPPPDASKLNPAISNTLADAIIRAMAKDPTDRFNNLSEFVTELTP